jgi:hypothetical protein
MRILKDAVDRLEEASWRIDQAREKQLTLDPDYHPDRGLPDDACQNEPLLRYCMCKMVMTISNERRDTMELENKDRQEQENRFECPLCGAAFATQKKLKNHEKKEHQVAD